MFAASQRAERHSQRLEEVRDVCEIKRASRSLTETGSDGFGEDYGGILEPFWNSKSIKNALKNGLIF